MKFIFQTILSALAVFILALQPAIAMDKTDSNTPTSHNAMSNMVVAKVNGDAITMDRLNREIIKLRLKKYGRDELPTNFASQIKGEAINNLIAEELIYQWAKKTIDPINPSDVDKRLAEFEIQFRGRNNYLNYIMPGSILTDQELNIYVERLLAIERALEKQISSEITISEDEIKQVYETNKENFTENEIIQVTKLLLFLDPGDPESIQKGKQLLKKIERELNNNLSALEASDYYHINNNVKINPDNEPDLYSAAKKLKENEISDVINIEGTLHIIQLTGYRPRLVKTFNEVKEGLKGQLLNQKKKSQLANLLAGLKKDADIELLDFMVE